MLLKDEVRELVQTLNGFEQDIHSTTVLLDSMGRRVKRIIEILNKIEVVCHTQD